MADGIQQSKQARIPSVSSSHRSCSGAPRLWDQSPIAHPRTLCVQFRTTCRGGPHLPRCCAAVVKMNSGTDTQYAIIRAIAELMLKNYDGVLDLDGELGKKSSTTPVLPCHSCGGHGCAGQGGGQRSPGAGTSLCSRNSAHRVRPRSKVNNMKWVFCVSATGFCSVRTSA
jgi:hypothetical protein